MREWVGAARGRGRRAFSAMSPKGTGRVRSRRRRVGRGVFAFGLLLVTHGLAGADTDYTRPGGYVGVGGVYAVDASAISVVTENSMGLTTRLGYRFTPNLAFEGQFEWIDGFDIVADPGHRLETWSLTGNVKGLLMTGRIQPFGILGMGVLRTRFVDAGSGLPSPFDSLRNVTSSLRPEFRPQRRDRSP